MHLHPGDGEGGEELACKGRSTLSDLRHLRALGIRFSGRPWQNKGKMCRLLKGLAVGTAMCRLLKGLAASTYKTQTRESQLGSTILQCRYRYMHACA